MKRYDLIQESARILDEKLDGVKLIPVYDQSHATVAKLLIASNDKVLASEHEGSPIALRKAMAM